MKVFVTRAIDDTGINTLQNAGFKVTVWREKRSLTPDELISHCLGHDALLSVGNNKLDAHFLNTCRHLKVIALHAVGYDNVDVAAATALKIPIGNTPGVLSRATADIAFLLMLATSRKAFYHHKRILRNDWHFFEPMLDLGQSLDHKTLGVFGLGNIGLEMAKRCVGAYDMKLIYHNRNRNLVAEQQLNATWVSFDDLLQQSDVLSVHTALTPETKGVFDSSAFRKMKASAIFINTARGAIHNEADLITALNEGAIWGAGLDVTNPEPMMADNVLLSMPNVSILPHIGSNTKETRLAMQEIAVGNIIAGVNGERLPHVVNPEVYE